MTYEEWEVEMEYQRLLDEQAQEVMRNRRELRQLVKGCVVGLVGSAGIVGLAYLIVMGVMR